MATAPVLEREVRVTSKRATETMQALVFRAPHQIGIEQVPVPKPGYGDVVIKVTPHYDLRDRSAYSSW
jgi:hypothetical protein